MIAKTLFSLFFCPATLCVIRKVYCEGPTALDQEGRNGGVDVVGDGFGGLRKGYKGCFLSNFTIYSDTCANKSAAADQSGSSRSNPGYRSSM
jgi:hypothetical protein